MYYLVLSWIDLTEEEDCPHLILQPDGHQVCPLIQISSWTSLLQKPDIQWHQPKYEVPESRVQNGGMEIDNGTTFTNSLPTEQLDHFPSYLSLPVTSFFPLALPNQDNDFPSNLAPTAILIIVPGN